MADRTRILSLINAAWTTQVVAAACELGIPDLLQNGGLAAREIAARAKADPDSVHRLLRALTVLELCTERARRFALTRDGALLTTSHPESLAAWACLSGSLVWENWTQLAQCIRTGQSARSRLRGVDDFTFLDADQKHASVFNAAMVNLTEAVAESVACVLDWNNVNSFVDVGGGIGMLAITLQREHEHLTGIVFDLPHASHAASCAIAAAGLGSRCQFVTGSFFDTIPPRHDAYLLKSVLHNWSDDRAVAVLTRCKEAMHRTSMLQVIERILPLTPSTAATDRDVVRSDLNMLVGCGGRERTLPQFDALFERAGLERIEVRTLTHALSAIEARPRAS